MDNCQGCGGGIDNDHPDTCSACLHERVTGRSYERDVDAARKRKIPLAEYVRRMEQARVLELKAQHLRR